MNVPHASQEIIRSFFLFLFFINKDLKYALVIIGNNKKIIGINKGKIFSNIFNRYWGLLFFKKFHDQPESLDEV